MGLRVFVLIILTGIFWWAGPYVYKGHKECLECHTPHIEIDGTCTDCHRGDPRTQRINIAHYRLIQGKYACFTLPENSDVKDGQRLINGSGCRRCHRTGNQGNRLAWDLDASFEKTLPEALADAIKYPGIFMPNFYFQDTDISRLVNAVLYSSAVHAPTSDEDIEIIHFEKDINDSDNIFNRRCGSCHRILTAQFGGLGSGDIGPNLSGIFSRFYFKNFKYGKFWDSARLKQWLKNPRDIRVDARMLPIELTKDELRYLIHILDS